MTNCVLLDNIDHQHLRVAPRYGVTFGDAVNQVLVFPTEFAPIQRDYPIVFRRSADRAFHAVALLGLDRDENLFLDGDRWRARYVPAIRQRGPFITGFGPPRPDGTPGDIQTHIDLDDPRVGDADGQPLFLRHGGNTPYLRHIEDVLDTIRRGHDATGPMTALLVDLDLLAATAIEVDLGDGRSYVVDDVHVVTQDRLDGLGTVALERLHRSGFLQPTVMAAASLDNINHLIDLKRQSEAGR